MQRAITALRDVKVAFGVVVGMLLAGVVLPLASPEADVTTTAGFDDGLAGSEFDSFDGADGFAADGTGSDGALDPSAGGDPGADGAGTGGPGGFGGSIDGGPSGPGGATGDGGGNDGRQGPGSGPAAARTASDRGITADTVKVGVALADLDTLSRTGLAATNGTVADRTRVWKALVAHANEQGGADGRTIEVVVDSFDPLDQNGATSACRRLAEDHGVFIIFADVGWTGPAAVCATRQYGLPNLGYDPQDVRTFRESNGMLFTALPSNERILFNEAQTLHQRGLLKNKTIGLVERQGWSDAHESIQIPTLQSLGYEVTHRSVLSQDLSTAQSQIPVEIQQMRSKGVNLILWGGDPAQANIWLNQAQKSGYDPTYSFSDFNSGTDDFNVQAVGEPVDAYGWATRRVINRNTDRPKAKSDEACTKRASSGSGLSMAYSTDLYWNTVRYCSHLGAFIDAFAAAGPNPTRRAFAGALANLGQRADFEVGPADVGGSWRPGKYDAPDHVHLIRHDLSCRCFRPSGDWFPMKSLPG